MKNHRPQFIFTVLALIVIALPIAAQGAAETSSNIEPVVSVLDSRGIEISLREYPDRIVSLSPNITETLFALGLGDKMVGRTDYCDYPEQAKSIPAMGDLLSPSVEKIVAAEPDLVIISNLGQLHTIEAIELAGIPVAFIDEPQKMEGTYRIIEKVGALTGTTEKANSIVDGMQAMIDSIEPIPVDSRPTIYYVAGFGEWGDFTATGDTFLHDIITLAGGDNIASEAINWSFQLELLHAKDPDMLILPPLWGSTFEETLGQFVNHPSYSSLSAVKQGNIIPVDSNMIERQGPRSAQAVEQLAKDIRKFLR